MSKMLEQLTTLNELLTMFGYHGIQILDVNMKEIHFEDAVSHIEGAARALHEFNGDKDQADGRA